MTGRTSRNSVTDRTKGVKNSLVLFRVLAKRSGVDYALEIMWKCRLCAFVLLLVIASPTFAQKATRRALKKPVTTAPSTKMLKSADVDEMSLDEPKVSPRETALRKVGIATFGVGGGLTADQAIALARQLTNDLTAMSYLEATQVSASSDKGSRAELLKSVNDAGLDGAITGAVTRDAVKITILTKSGEPISNLTVSREINLASEAQVKAVSRAIVDEIARNVPYRGFVTRRVGKDLYEINLGKKQGILVGQRFRLFEFSANTLSSERKDMAEAEVIEVSESTAVIEPTGSADVRLFSKVGFNENARGMTTSSQIETRGYARFGGGLLNVSGTGDPKYVNRAYNISSAPGLVIGGGYNKWAADVLFAQATGEDTDLVYLEGLISTRVYELPFGGLNKFSVLAGARMARVSVTTKRNIVTPLESTTSISPAFEARLDRIIKGPVRGYVGASAYFPIYVSGMDFSAIIFSYGIGGDAGLSLDLSQRLFLDVGARYHLIRRPVEGQTSVNETYTELVGAIGYRF